MKEDKAELEVITVNWAEYYDKDKITPPAYVLKRLDDKKNNRYYYESEPFETRAGITSLLQRVLPPSFAIQEWQKKFGEKADYMLQISSKYGTASHILYKDWVVYRKVNEEQLQKCISYCREYGANEDMPYKDFVCFMKFCEDYNVKSLLCEAMIKAKFHNEWYALTLDLLCEMTFKTKEKQTVKEEKTRKVYDEVADGIFKSGKRKGEVKMKKVERLETYSVDKEITVEKNTTRLCLVDFKSNFFEKSEKDFYESHLFQLMAAKEAVKQNFDLDVNVLMNYAPNNWRVNPDYSKKIWEATEADVSLFKNLLEQARLRGYFQPKGSVFIELPITPETKYSEAYTFFNYEQYAQLLEQKQALQELTE